MLEISSDIEIERIYCISSKCELEALNTGSIFKLLNNEHYVAFSLTDTLYDLIDHVRVAVYHIKSLRITLNAMPHMNAIRNIFYQIW